MHNLQNVLRAQRMLRQQTMQLAKLVDPKQIIASGKEPTHDEMLLAALDGIGLTLHTLQVLIEEFVALAHPEVFEKGKTQQ